MGRAAQPGKVGRLEMGGGFQFHVNQMAALAAGLDQNVNLGGRRSTELAAIGGPPAGGHDDGFGVIFPESLDLRQRQGGLAAGSLT